MAVSPAQTRSPDEIVVATDQASLVGRLLRDKGLPVETKARSGRLGLTLLDLRSEPPYTQIAEELEAEAEKQGGRRTPLPPDAEPLDPLLTAVRDWFEVQYAGWTPTMGKNRVLSGVELLPYASVGGFDRPHRPPRSKSPSRPQPEPSDDGQCSRPVPVGIIDTRMVRHRRLEGAYLVAPDALDLPDVAAREGWRGHATFVADVVLSEAPSARLDIRTALRSEAGQPARMLLWTLAERLEEFESSGVQVLNCSLGCKTRDGKPPLVLERAIARLTSDMIVVAAAGNHGLSAQQAAELGDAVYSGAVEQSPEDPSPDDEKAVLFPAALDGVLAVGALNESREGAAVFNPRGARQNTCAPWIDLLAPGTKITSAYFGDLAPEDVSITEADGTTVVETFEGWAEWTGTSFAAAHVTGTIAAELAGGRPREKVLDRVRRQFPSPWSGDTGDGG